MPLGEIVQRTHEDGTEYTVFTCSSCETEHNYEYEAEDCCVFWCENCGSQYDTEERLEECCNHECDECGARYSYAEDAEECCEEQRQRRVLFSPDYPMEIDATPIGHSLFVEALADERPARLCSIEQELTRGAMATAVMLNRIGISQLSGILNYSQDGYPGEAFVKQDGTLPDGGGEVVFSRFNLAGYHDASRVSKGLACIQAMQEQGIVEIGSQAGVHVHISAVDVRGEKVFGPAQMASLWEIFSFGEDVIYRLGAAGWPTHRGTEYTRILPKMNRPDLGGFTAGKISKEAQQHRYFSINFRRLLDAVAGCSCGACMVGDWNDCDCGALNRGTIEWRVFNASTDPATLHSWVLLAHGVTAAAFDHPLGTLPPNEFGNTARELHPWIFGWLLWNCPFRNEERQLLFDTARRAPGLYLPWDNIDLFHENWGQIEAPEVLVLETSVDGEYDSFDDDAQVATAGTGFDNCSCWQCRVDRGEIAPEDVEEAETWPSYHDLSG